MDVVNKDMKVTDAREDGGSGSIAAPMRGTASRKKEEIKQ